MLNNTIVIIFVGAFLAHSHTLLATQQEWYCGGYCAPEDVVVLDSGATRQQSEFTLESDVMFSFVRYTRNMYSKYLKSNPNFEGMMYIKFSVNSAGAVFNDTILQSTTENDAFDKEIMAKLRKCKWATIKGGPTTVAFPLVFWKLATNTMYRTDEEHEEWRNNNPKVNPKKLKELDYIIKRKIYRNSVTLEKASCNCAPCDAADATREFTLLFNKHVLPYIKHWYDNFCKVSKKNVEKNGSITLKVTIAENGGVPAVDIVSDNMGNAGVGNDIKRMFAPAKWDIKTSCNTTCTLTLKFLEKMP